MLINLETLTNSRPGQGREKETAGRPGPKGKGPAPPWGGPGALPQAGPAGEYKEERPMKKRKDPWAVPGAAGPGIQT